MGKIRSEIDDAARQFIEAQQIFFVASAPLDAAGHVNLSPKGLDTFRILGPTTVAYLDFNGSGVETIAHLKENGRIVLMFCAFQGPPNIFRLYGHGRVVEAHEAEFAELAAIFEIAKMRGRLLWSRITRVQDSCGYGVPLFKYEGERDTVAGVGAQSRGGGVEGVSGGEEPEEYRWAAGSGGVNTYDEEKISRIWIAADIVRRMRSNSCGRRGLIGIPSTSSGKLFDCASRVAARTDLLRSG